MGSILYKISPKYAKNILYCITNENQLPCRWNEEFHNPINPPASQDGNCFNYSKQILTDFPLLMCKGVLESRLNLVCDRCLLKIQNLCLSQNNVCGPQVKSLSRKSLRNLGFFSLNEVMLKMKNIRSSAGSVVEVEILE